MEVRDFLSRHHMDPSQLDREAIISAFCEEMQKGCQGLPSSLGMFPAYIHAAEPVEGRVLVIDAGGTNLRLARLSYEKGKLSVEKLVKRSMPGTAGTITAEEFFHALALELLPLCEDVERACFCFSYPCEVLSNGDGRAVRLTKELSVESLPGMQLCAPLEAELVKLGAKGHRRWRVINDTVGSMLSGMAQTPRPYDDYIGFILGTGFNMCANVRSELLTKAPAATLQGESCIVNFESGGFDRFLRGTADERLDAKSEIPGAQLVEKCISGAYQAPILMETLALAGEEGLVSPETAALSLSSVEVSALAENGPEKLYPAMSDVDYAFLLKLNALLLERAAILSACCLAAAIRSRALPAGSRVLISADGTTFRRNPLLKPLTTRQLDELLAPYGLQADFIHFEDSTLLGTAYAALLP